jgi:hypothetical protein
MVETPLAFNFSKTRTVCDAFDDAWAFLQGIGSDLTEPSKSLASRTILAKRIIQMADQGLMDVTELRDDALAFVQRNPPSRQQSQRPPLRVGRRLASASQADMPALGVETAPPGPQVRRASATATGQ